MSAIRVVDFFGSPIVALGIGTLLAIYGLVPKEDNKTVLKMMDDAIKDTGIIMLITGAGGSLGNVVKVSGIGTALGEMVTSWALPAVLIPFIIAAFDADCTWICNSCDHNSSFPDSTTYECFKHQPASYVPFLLRRCDFILLLQ